MKPIRSVYNYGTFYGVRQFGHGGWYWWDGKRMDGAHINDAALYSRRSTAERYAAQHVGEVVEVSQTLAGRCVPQRTRTTDASPKE